MVAEAVVASLNQDVEITKHGVDAPQENGSIAINGDAQANGSVESKRLKEAEKRRRRRKQKKGKNSSHIANGNSTENEKDDENGDGKGHEGVKEAVEDVEIEYVSEMPTFEDDGFKSLVEDFQKIFQKFASPADVFPSSKDDDTKENGVAVEESKKKTDSDDEDDEDEDDKLKDKGLSNKKKKLQRRMKIAELKQQCVRPDVVEVWDATAADPRLLVFLKAYRNTVPVPRHWCQKRKFLQDVAQQEF